MTFTARLAQQQGQGEFPGRLPKTFSSNCEGRHDTDYEKYRKTKRRSCIAVHNVRLRFFFLLERGKAVDVYENHVMGFGGVYKIRRFLLRCHSASGFVQGKLASFLLHEWRCGSSLRL